MQITFSYLYFQKYAVVIVLILYKEVTKVAIIQAFLQDCCVLSFVKRNSNITHLKHFVNSFFKLFLIFFENF